MQYCARMIDMKYYLFAIVMMFTFSVYAQEAEEEMFNVQRPEHVYQYADGGVRRLPFRVGSRQTAPLTCYGSPKVPVVLVQFADRPFYASGKTVEEVLQSYDLFFNGMDKASVKASVGSYGSIRDYFNDQSLGQFTPEFKIIGPVTLSRGYAHYGKNSGSKDLGVNEFFTESMSELLRSGKIDWSVFDNDGDGVVDMVFFIHAGWGENTVSKYDPDALWAKESTTAMSLKDDKGNITTFGCYGLCAEARPISTSKIPEDIESNLYGTAGYNPDNLRMDGVGVCIHELSHALGLPDFYDTKNVAFGMDIWSVMDYGEYGQNSFGPCGYTAYERDFMGWQKLVELTDTCVLNIKPFAEGGCGYKVVNEANSDEYYVLENRQPLAWDTCVCLKGSGLMVTHVDYSAARWNNNSVNTDPNHQRMTIIAANDNYHGTNLATSAAEWLECLAGNLFPYVLPSQSLNNTTVPAAIAYGGGTMDKPIYDITREDDGSITLYYLKSKLDYERATKIALASLDEDGLVDVYAMNGMHVDRCSRDDVHRLALNRGIYLLRLSNGKVLKVLF